MYKFIITINLKPGTRDEILAAAPEVQAKTRAEAGCLAYDFYTCTDDENKLIFVEAWKSKAAHEFHCEQDYTKAFIAFHEPKNIDLKFETINVET